MIKYYLLLVLVFSNYSQAEQVYFSKNKREDSYHFSYRWLTPSNLQETLKFSLKQQIIFDRFRSFTAYQEEVSQEKITQQIYKDLKKNPIKDARVSFKKKDKHYIIEVTGKGKDSINKAWQAINILKKEKTDQYLKANYYHYFTSYQNEILIKPNHVDIANQSIEDLKPLKSIFIDNLPMKNIKTATNYTLNFVQNIPYSTLESRQTSSGAGFNPPLKLLWENQGDCDSKVTLTAALLRMLMPRVKMIFVFLDEHALIGIQVNAEGDDNHITVDNIKYVLAEPTGPAMYKLGELAPESEMAIANGHYTVEKYHAIKKSFDPKAKQKHSAADETHFSDDNLENIHIISSLEQQ